MANAGNPRVDTAVLKGLLSPLQISRKIFVPNVVHEVKYSIPKLCGDDGMER